jgi:hypothetical protein
MMRWKRLFILGFFLMMAGCAGFQRGCSSCTAQSFGSDWIVVQYAANGDPINCWRLQNVSIANETNSDGVYWKEGSGHLVHISGWYNRVQVDGGRFEEAARLLGVELSKITNGKYLR